MGIMNGFSDVATGCNKCIDTYYALPCHALLSLLYTECEYQLFLLISVHRNQLFYIRS